MIIPQIHSNGTSRRELLQQISDVNSALNETLRVLAKMHPNGRDYYHTGNLQEAEAQHRIWVDAIKTVQEEIMAMGEAIADQ